MTGRGTGSTSAYYWAGGERIPLRADVQVAVDLDAAGRAGVAASWLRRFERDGRPLTGANVLVDDTSLDDSVREQLDRGGALHPVFRSSDGTLLVVLPEVRVEPGGAEAAAKVKAAIDDSGIPAKVTEAGSGRLVVVPASGRGADALTLANEIYERARPDLAQARFVRVLARP